MSMGVIVALLLYQSIAMLLCRLVAILLTSAMAKRRALTPEEEAVRQRLRDMWGKTQAAWRARGDRLTQAIAADYFGWSEQSAVSQYLTGKLPLNIDVVIKFADLLGVYPSDIWPDIGRIRRNWDSPADMVSDWAKGQDKQTKPDQLTTPVVDIRYYPDVAASAGHGCLPISEATVLMMKVARSMLERRGVDPDNAALLQADGDSMRGTVNHGDLMLLNLADNTPRDGRVYVVSVGDDVLVKRVQRVPNGIKLIADNPVYDSIAIMDEDQGTDVSVVGRVVIAWQSNDLIE